MATSKRGAALAIAAAQRQRRALELRRAGAAYRAIADTLACSVATAHDDVRAALADLTAKTRAEAAALRGVRGGIVEGTKGCKLGRDVKHCALLDRHSRMRCVCR